MSAAYEDVAVLVDPPDWPAAWPAEPLDDAAGDEEVPGFGRDVDPTRRYQIGNAVDDFRWLLSEMGRRGLSGFLLRGPRLVFVPAVGEDGYIPPMREEDHNGPATVREVTADHVVTRLAVEYFVYKLRKRKTGKGPGAVETEEEIEAFFPKAPADHALRALDQAPNLEMLRGVTHTPMVRADGSILDVPGFDEDTGYLYLPTVDVPRVPASPTGDQVTAAVAMLRNIVAQFAWAGEHDEANFLGLMLTPLLRLLTPPPYKLGAIMARQPGSGKSLLAETIRTVHGGVFRSEMPHDDAELEKSISSILTCTTAPVVEFDNVSGTLRSSRLAGLLTTADYSGRLLGSTNSVDMVNDRLWTITGNNLNLGGDLVRRALWVTIDPGCPDPHLRTGFRLDIPRYVAGHRGEILHALLTLVAAWVVAGKPMQKRSSDSYALWSAAVRGILLHAGVPGEFDHPDSAQQSVGSDDEGWGDFLLALRPAFGARTFTTRDLVDRMATANYKDEVAQGLVDTLPGQLHDQYLRSHESARAITRSLGMWLKNRNGRWAGDLVLEGAGKDSSKNVPLWRVRTAEETRAAA